MFHSYSSSEQGRADNFSGVGRSHFYAIAKLVGMASDQARRLYEQDVARLGASDRRRKLEVFARAHLGTAAVAVLHGSGCS